jgi:hypothetical protein
MLYQVFTHPKTIQTSPYFDPSGSVKFQASHEKKIASKN